SGIGAVCDGAMVQAGGARIQDERTVRALEDRVLAEKIAVRHQTALLPARAAIVAVDDADVELVPLEPTRARHLAEEHRNGQPSARELDAVRVAGGEKLPRDRKFPERFRDLDRRLKRRAVIGARDAESLRQVFAKN